MLPRREKHEQRKIGASAFAKVFHEANAFEICQSAVSVVEDINDLMSGKISGFIIESFAVEDRFAEHPHLLVIKVGKE